MESNIDFIPQKGGYRDLLAFQKATCIYDIPSRSAETIANIAIILIHQADTLLRLLIERQKTDFLKSGGIREEMSRARIAYRQQQNGKK